MSSATDPARDTALPLGKRILDLVFILATAPLTLPLGAVVWAIILLREGGPVIYRARRAGQGGQVFAALKFRTMRPVEPAQDQGVSGGDKQFRISGFSAFLRRTRLDELPQLINILKGDMTLVGPRPPDPRYVAMYPELYARVLRSRPGLTGLATLYMHRFEDRVLKTCETARETEEVYCRRCIPRKARLDLMCQRQRTLCSDLALIGKTAAKPFRRKQ